MTEQRTVEFRNELERFKLLLRFNVMKDSSDVINIITKQAEDKEPNEDDTILADNDLGDIGDISDMIKEIGDVFEKEQILTKTELTMIQNHMTSIGKATKGRLGISEEEKIMIVKAMNLKQGHWYKCPKGIVSLFHHILTYLVLPSHLLV